MLVAPLWWTIVQGALAGDCRLALESRFEAPFQVYAASAAAVGDDVVLAGGSGPDGVGGAVWRLVGLAKWEPVDAAVDARRYGGGAAWTGADGAPRMAVVDGYGFDADKRVARPGIQTVALGAKPGVATIAKSPVERYLSGVAAVDGKLYAAGGHAEGRVFHDRVDVWDTATAKWAPGPPLAEARDTQLVVADGRLYALGGFSGEGCEPSSVVERLLPDGSGWERRAPMFDAISAFSAVYLDGGIFTFGDYDKLDVVTRYDIATDEWAQLQVDFTPRRHSAAVAVGDRVVVVGGTVALEGSWLGTTEVYRWTCE